MNPEILEALRNMLGPVLGANAGAGTATQLDNIFNQAQGVLDSTKSARFRGNVDPMRDIEAFRVNPFKGFLAAGGGLVENLPIMPTSDFVLPAAGLIPQGELQMLQEFPEGGQVVSYDDGGMVVMYKKGGKTFFGKLLRKAGKVAKGWGNAVGKVAKFAAPVVSMIPGVGTLAGIGLGAAGGALDSLIATDREKRLGTNPKFLSSVLGGAASGLLGGIGAGAGFTGAGLKGILPGLKSMAGGAKGLAGVGNVLTGFLGGGGGQQIMSGLKGLTGGGQQAQFQAGQFGAPGGGGFGGFGMPNIGMGDPGIPMQQGSLLAGLQPNLSGLMGGIQPQMPLASNLIPNRGFQHGGTVKKFQEGGVVINALVQNQNVPFIRRMLDSDAPVMKREDGKISTHLLETAEVDGKFIVYPTLVQRGNELFKPKDPTRYALDNRNFIQFNTQEDASDFAKGAWKPAVETIKASKTLQFQEGGMVGSDGIPLMPIQTEKGEMFIHLDGGITKVNATKLHKHMDDDEVTDIVPEGTYVASADKKLKIKYKEAEDIIMAVKSYPYEEGKQAKQPEEIEFSALWPGNSKKDLTPAELAELIRKKWMTIDKDKDMDIFTTTTNAANIQSRLPFIERLIMLNEDRNGNSDFEFKKGGKVLRMGTVDKMPQGGFMQTLGDIAGVAGTAIPLISSFFGGKQQQNQLDPTVRNMILGSSPLHALGLTNNIRSQQGALDQAMSDFTGLGQNLNQLAMGQTGINVLSRLGQDLNLPRFDFQSARSRLMNLPSRTPRSFIDAAGTPLVDTRSVIRDLGPRGAASILANAGAAQQQARNQMAMSQFNQDRQLGVNMAQALNALDLGEQQANIPLEMQEQQARNQRIAGIGSDMSSLLGRFGDIQSQILPQTTGFNLTRAMLAGQIPMGIAQNMLNTGATLGTLQGFNQPQPQSQFFSGNITDLLTQRNMNTAIGGLEQQRANAGRNYFKILSKILFPKPQLLPAVDKPHITTTPPFLGAPPYSGGAQPCPPGQCRNWVSNTCEPC